MFIHCQEVVIQRVTERCSLLAVPTVQTPQPCGRL
jgi:hypothetical protein